MVTAFLKKWYPPSKKAKIRDKIYDFKQRPGEQLYEAWERFKEYLQKSPNHGLSEHICYTSKNFPLACSEQTNEGYDAWHSNNVDVVPYGSAMIQNMVKENLDTQQTLIELATNIFLLTKKFDETQIKKVNVCEDDTVMPKGMYQTQDGPFHDGPPMQVEDANYVNNSQGGYQRQNYQGGYQNQNQWRPQQGQGAYNNSGNYNNNYGGANQGSYNNSNNFGNKSSNPYIQPKGQSTEQAAIQKLESQMRDISREQHPPKKGGLSSDTIPNPKNGGGGVDRVFSITTRSGKILQRVDKKVVDLEPIDEEEEVQSETQIIVNENPTDKKGANIPEIVKEANNTSKQTAKGALRPWNQLFKSKPPFSREHLTKKKTVQHETVSLTHTVSSIISTTTVQKKGDHGAFTIPCSVGHNDFARALCDNGASINLMPLAIYKQSGLGMPRPTTMRVQMADRSIKRPVGMVDDVLVWVGEFMLPANFVILDYAVDRDIPIILGRPRIIGRALIDLEKNEIKL
ncbi:uncharacterized protein LOC132039124 [Lycium ferocissimum]|uniref:uncharacterized protein LOC132039124 n=1 Tax=Lycium ferocissimum TaxID=112874 RepID=UPI002815ECA9|nr:uncharacterized protein LOC132039124 [Lycium ferocissimum]